MLPVKKNTQSKDIVENESKNITISLAHTKRDWKHHIVIIGSSRKVCNGRVSFLKGDWIWVFMQKTVILMDFWKTAHGSETPILEDLLDKGDGIC